MISICDMLANICPSCRTGGVHNLPVLTIFYPVAGKRTGTISHAATFGNIFKRIEKSSTCGIPHKNLIIENHVSFNQNSA